jgi:outer membrane protein assembly factor BamB
LQDSWGGWAYAINAETGEIIWSNPLGGATCLSGSGVGGGRHYVSTMKTNTDPGKQISLAALDIANGEIEWYKTYEYNAWCPPFYHNEVVYMMHFGFRAYDAATGELLLHYVDPEKGIRDTELASSTAITDGEAIYWKNGENRVYAFNFLKR